MSEGIFLLQIKENLMMMMMMMMMMIHRSQSWRGWGSRPHRFSDGGGLWVFVGLHEIVLYPITYRNFEIKKTFQSGDF